MLPSVLLYFEHATHLRWFSLQCRSFQSNSYSQRLVFSLRHLFNLNQADALCQSRIFGLGWLPMLFSALFSALISNRFVPTHIWFSSFGMHLLQGYLASGSSAHGSSAHMDLLQIDYLEMDLSEWIFCKEIIWNGSFRMDLLQCCKSGMDGNVIF